MGLYLPSPLVPLLRAADAFRFTWSEEVFGRPSRSSRVRHQNALTEKAWEGRRTGTRLGLGKGKQGLYFSGYTLRDRTIHF